MLFTKLALWMQSVTPLLKSSDYRELRVIIATKIKLKIFLHHKAKKCLVDFFGKV